MLATTPFDVQSFTDPKQQLKLRVRSTILLLLELTAWDWPYSEPLIFGCRYATGRVRRANSEPGRCAQVESGIE